LIGFGEVNLKTLWALSAFILFFGGCVLVYSHFPETVKEPYTTFANLPRDNVLTNGIVKAYRIYYDGYKTLDQGDRVSIVASNSAETLTARVIDCSNLLAPNVISSRENVSNINLDVTIPRSGYYEIEVSRYRRNEYIIFLDQINATVRVITHTTEQVSTQAYRDVTIYPHKDLQTPAIAILVAGIGVGVLTIAQGTPKNRQLTYSTQTTQTENNTRTLQESANDP